MKPFDCLHQDAPLFGPHLLEASAGTGKTFSIEHVYVRLILEKIGVEHILAVTFTRAATRELKKRIRENLEKALLSLEKQDPIWPYLNAFIGSKEAIFLLKDALRTFDQCQIFTIHGFCCRMLQEFAFEANIDPFSEFDEKKRAPLIIKQACLDFLDHGMDEDLIHPYQLPLIMKKFSSKEEIVQKLLEQNPGDLSDRFSSLFERCKAALHAYQKPLPEKEKLQEDFDALYPNYRVGISGDFPLQVKALCHLDHPDFFALLLQEKGTIFDFLDPLRKKVKAKECTLHYPDFFSWAKKSIFPLLKIDPLPVLQGAWSLIYEKLVEKEGYIDPDRILLKMQEALKNPPFCALAQQKYQAVIIDEFQDTDAIQWDIFERLFFQPHVRALYLVGDPKQSIYRFRKADLYTYMKAKKRLKEENIYYLGTNFRSSYNLVQTLNALFQRDWLDLPKLNQTLPYLPVNSGAKISSDFSDGKGAIHCFVTKENSPSIFEEVFLPMAVKEIQKLGHKSFALLLKDRYQIQKARTFLTNCGIDCVAKSYESLEQTDAFRAICELFDAVFSPRDPSLVKRVQTNPFYKKELSLFSLYSILEEKGLPFFAKQLPLDSDGLQIFEHLFMWEKKEGFSIEGVKRELKKMKDKEYELIKEPEIKPGAVQIMTLHISKGLEFDVVFALGLAFRTKESQEPDEINAEKKRQLYVAMTRAKKRLYLPIIEEQKEASLGTESPMELFSSHFDAPFLQALEEIGKKESLTMERIDQPISFDVRKVQEQKPIEKPLIQKSFTPSFLQSFTSLSKCKHTKLKQDVLDPDLHSIQSMPKGADTGVLIHSLFEKIFRKKEPIWKSFEKVKLLIEQELKLSSLEPWTGPIQEMAINVLSRPFLGSFSLSELEPDELAVEMEFIYRRKEHFIKGFIDLVFIRDDRVYFIDWKTNWLLSYREEEIEEEMKLHDYYLQASLYRKALEKGFELPFGGAFYVFLRAEEFVKVEKFCPLD